MLSPEDALRIYNLLVSHHIQVWIVGGWGIDALLGEQTRPHKDLDILMLLDDVLHMRELLSCKGFSLKELWSENRQAIDARGNETATAFVLRDPQGREIDAHALVFDAQGCGIPAWNNDEGFIFTAQDLGETGVIAGVRVCCMSAAMQMRCHTGYTLPEYQKRDLALLLEKFKMDDPTRI